MSQPMNRKRRLANERALYRYSQALERGDIDTIAKLLQEASQNEDLERMMYAMQEQEQSSGQQPALPNRPRTPEFFPTLRSQPGAGKVKRPLRARRPLQLLAAVLVAAMLIAGSALLFSSRRPTTVAVTVNLTKTPQATKTVVAPQGLVILLLTNGMVQAVRGATGQVVWSYSTGQTSVGDVNELVNRSMIAHQQTIYVLTRKSIVVLNEQNGKLLWQKQLPVQLADISPDSSQIQLDSGVLYVSLESEPESEVYALRASDGQVLWHAASTDVDPPLVTASNGVAYVAIQNAAQTETTLEARRASDGSVLWQSVYPGVISFGTVANQVLYLYAFPGDSPDNPGGKINKRLLALQTSNGKTIWSHDLNYGNYTDNVLYSQGVLVLADRYSQICGFSASNGSQLWCVPEQANSNGNGLTIGSYLAGPDQLYVAFLNQQVGAPSQQSLQVKALDYRTGQATWTSASLSYSMRISGFIPLDLVQLQQNTLLIGDGSPQVVALETTSGHTLWQINGPTPKNQVLKIAATN